MPRLRAHAYIDGFNLYYGIKKWPRYKWLDLEQLIDRLFPDDDVALIRYFTAKVKGSINTEAPGHQNTYLRALGTLPRVQPHFGKFNINKVWLPLNMPSRWTVPVLKPEEKGSDVNLATYLLVDALTEACEKAIVVSNDTDLREPIRFVQRPPLSLPITVVNPLRPYKADMGAGHHLDMHVADVRDSQFADEVVLANGKRIRRPDAWKGGPPETQRPAEAGLYPAVEAAGLVEEDDTHPVPGLNHPPVGGYS